MSDIFIVLPNQIFYTKYALKKMISNGISEIVIIEDPSYFIGCKEHVISQISAMKLYEDVLNNIIRQSNHKTKVTYITGTSKSKGDIITYLNTRKSTGKAWMFKPTLYRNELWKYKFNGLPIEFYSSPNYLVSTGDMMFRMDNDISYDDFKKKFKKELRRVNENPIILTNDNISYDKYYNMGKNHYNALVKQKVITSKECNNNVNNFPIDSFNAIKVLNSSLNSIGNQAKGKGTLTYNFNQFLQSDMNNLLNMGILTPEIIASILKPKNSNYSDVVMDCIIKREYLYYSYCRNKEVVLHGKKSWNTILKEAKLLDNEKSTNDEKIKKLINNNCSQHSFTKFLEKEGFYGETLSAGLINNYNMTNINTIF